MSAVLVSLLPILLAERIGLAQDTAYGLATLSMLMAGVALAILREARERWRRLMTRLERIEQRILFGGSATRPAQGGAVTSPNKVASDEAARAGALVDEARTILRTALARTPPAPAPHAPAGRPKPGVAPSDLTPEVTVVIPLFNEERFIGDAIVSLKNQTLGNFSAIVVDDASTDRSADVALKAINGDPRFSLARHQKNSGASAARNTGLRLARKPFITFLDGDDFLLPNALELRLARLSELSDERVAGVYSAIAQAPEDVNVGYQPKSLTHKGVLKTFVNTDGQCPFNPHAPTLRTDVVRRLGGFDERMLQGCEDWDLWQRVLRHGYWFEPVHGVTAVYRGKRSSMVRRMPAQHLQAGRRIFDWAHRPLADEEAIPGTPYVFRQSVSVYREQAAFAGRTAQYAAMAYLHDPDDFHAALREVPDIWPQIEHAIGGSMHVQGGVERYLAANDATLASLRTDVAEVTSAVLSHIRSAAAAKEPPPRMEDRRPSFQVAFFAFNRRQAELFASLAVQLGKAGISSRLVSTETVSGDQGVQSAWSERGCEFDPYNTYALRADTLPSPVSVVMRPYDGVVGELAHREGTAVIEVTDPDAPVSLPDENAPAAPAAVVRAAELVEKIRGVLDEGSGHGSAVARCAHPDTSSVHLIGASSPLHIGKEERLDPPPDYEKIASLKNRFKGERCFIIGNGPSLNAIDVSKLRNDCVFAVNGIFYKQEEMGFDPTFYVVEDSSVMKENIAAIRAYRAGHKFFPTIYRDLHEAADNVQFFRMNRGFYERTSPSFCVPKFSFDAASRLYCGQSVTYINLQLAYYFGFKTVYLIGMDFAYVIPTSATVTGDLIRSAGDDPNHFHPAYFGAGKTWHDPKLHRVLLSYELARDIYAADGREIVNATHGGKLEVFRRASYESLF